MSIQELGLSSTRALASVQLVDGPGYVECVTVEFTEAAVAVVTLRDGGAAGTIRWRSTSQASIAGHVDAKTYFVKAWFKTGIYLEMADATSVSVTCSK